MWVHYLLKLALTAVDYLLSLIKEWGYIIVLFGSMIEGESIILAACVAAYFGYLSMPKIVIISFLGTLFADQGLYFVGRKYGQAMLDKFPKLKPAASRAFILLHKWDLWFILTFRFIYGIRTISPIIIGSSGITPRRFIPLNFFAAVIWTALSCSLGYMLGGILASIDYRIIEHYLLFVSLSLLAILITIGYMGWKKLSVPLEDPASLSKNPLQPNSSKKPEHEDENFIEKL